jgi:hypothetical protein
LPTDLSNLLLWLDASDASTITETLGAVSQWDDKSGNGNHVTQATSSQQPTTNSVTIGGVNAINFDGNDFLRRADSLGLTGNPAITVLTVVRPDTSGEQRMLMIGNQSPGNGIAYSWTDNSLRFNDGNVVWDTASNNASNEYCILWTRPAGTTYYASGVNCYEGGGTPLSKTGGVNEIDTLNMINTETSIGLGVAQGGAFQSYITGPIGEIMIYNSVPATADLNQLGAYENSKWAVPWSDI